MYAYSKYLQKRDLQVTKRDNVVVHIHITAFSLFHFDFFSL